jgi:hypothetical protein
MHLFVELTPKRSGPPVSENHLLNQNILWMDAKKKAHTNTWLWSCMCGSHNVATPLKSSKKKTFYGWTRVNEGPSLKMSKVVVYVSFGNIWRCIMHVHIFLKLTHAKLRRQNTHMSVSPPWEKKDWNLYEYAPYVSNQHYLESVVVDLDHHVQKDGITQGGDKGSISCEFDNATTNFDHRFNEQFFFSNLLQKFPCLDSINYFLGLVWIKLLVLERFIMALIMITRIYKISLIQCIIHAWRTKDFRDCLDT